MLIRKYTPPNPTPTQANALAEPVMGGFLEFANIPRPTATRARSASNTGTQKNTGPAIAQHKAAIANAFPDTEPPDNGVAHLGQAIASSEGISSPQFGHFILICPPLLL
jgi:hypothetical protein